jgi:hypothetical protein
VREILVGALKTLLTAILENQHRCSKGEQRGLAFEQNPALLDDRNTACLPGLMAT